jgi:hypothetical protein
MEKITIVDFYKKLSEILLKARASMNMKKEFDELIQLAESSNLKVSVDPSILEVDNLKKYDDESSYVEEDNTYINDEDIDDDSSYSY